MLTWNLYNWMPSLRATLHFHDICMNMHWEELTRSELRTMLKKDKSLSRELHSVFKWEFIRSKRTQHLHWHRKLWRPKRHLSRNKPILAISIPTLGYIKVYSEGFHTLFHPVFTIWHPSWHHNLCWCNLTVPEQLTLGIERQLDLSKPFPISAY